MGNYPRGDRRICALANIALRVSGGQNATQRSSENGESTSTVMLKRVTVAVELT
jgi:hypothetical protein